MKLSRLILYAIFTVSVTATILTFAVSIFFQYSSFKEDKKHLKTEYINYKKEEIKREVEKVHSYIQYQQKIIDKKVREKLRLRVQQAHEIATAIYRENRNKPINELKYLIVTAIKNISYEDKRAYFFINTNSGEAILFNKQSKLKLNQNVWNLQDRKGNYVVRRQSEIVKDKGEGFVINYFVKPDLKDNIQYPKLSFVKLFEPFDWHIGMGEYIDDMTEGVKQDVLSYIASIRFGSDGYIFVNNTKREALVFDGKKLSKPKYYPNDKLYAQQLKAIEKSDGDYFFYKFKKLNTNEEFPKMAYAKEFKNWGWIIGSGVYIDEVENEIIRKENILLNTILDKINVIFIFIIIMGIFIYLISQQISKYINHNIVNVIKSFNDASRYKKEMNINKLTYKEFETLSKSLNVTLKARNKIEEQLQEYIGIINENVITSSTNKEGIITDVSEAFCNISGYSKEELIGQSHNIIRHPEMPKELYINLWKNIKQGLSWEGEVKNKAKNEESYWVHILIKPTFEKGEIIGYTAIMQDITDKKRVEVLSITDDLTKLYNRRFFNETLDQELNRAKRSNDFLTFMMIDVDYFKLYNDTYGHHAGDNVLKKIAQVLKQHSKRAGDFAFRLGGEEFALLYTLRDHSKSEELAKYIQEDIMNLNIKHEGSQVSHFVTVSIGIYCQKAIEITSGDILYKKADEALYKAKTSGRNCICIDQ